MQKRNQSRKGTPEIVKTKENIGKSILKLTLEKTVIEMTPEEQAKKKKKKRQMGLYQTKSYCTTKKTISQVKKKPM